MASLKQMQRLTELHDDGWRSVDLHYRSDPVDIPIGGPIVVMNGYGIIASLESDGSIRYMVPQDDIPDDAPRPMWGDTPRGGVIGYMCKIDFECELGGTSAVIRPNAAQAMCTGTCGVVEVEVIGRRIILDECRHLGYVGVEGDVDESVLAAWSEKVKTALEDFDKSDRLTVPNLKAD